MIFFKKYSYLNPTVIIYGSNIYNGSSSDLDVCIILTKKDEESKALQPWLKDNYVNYLKSDIDKLTFIQNLIMAQNSTQVKQLTNNSPKNLLKIIKGVCDYK